MSKSTIAWTQETWNPVLGCSEVGPECYYCYAKRMTHRLGKMGQAAYTGLTILDQKGVQWTGELRLLPERLQQPYDWKKPRLVFVNSMSDLFHEEVPLEFIQRVFAVMRDNPQHRFQVLTKRSGRLAKLSKEIDWPGNVWIGVSVGIAKTKKRIDHLRNVNTPNRFLSLEPLLGDLGELDLSGIGWVILGGESGGGARPCDVKWIRKILSQGQEQGVPSFLKQLGRNPVGLRKLPEHPKGGDPSEWPCDLRVRQYPEAFDSVLSQPRKAKKKVRAVVKKRGERTKTKVTASTRPRSRKAKSKG